MKVLGRIHKGVRHCSLYANRNYNGAESQPCIRDSETAGMREDRNEKWDGKTWGR